MKKLILGIGLLGVLSVAGESAFAQNEKAEAAPQQVAADEFPAPPKFESEKANEGLAEFAALIKEYAPAIRTNDMTRMQEFGTKMQSWQQNVPGWAAELSQEEQAEMQQYMQKLAQTLQPAVAPVDPGAPSAAPETETPE